MLYELESSPFAQKPSTALTPKLKIPEYNQMNNGANNSTNSNGSPPKATTANGVGFTSDKVYGPELPPIRVEKKTNGACDTNGNDSDSDSESDEKSAKQSSPVKEMDISSSSNDAKCAAVSSKSPISSPNVSTSVSSLSSPEYAPKKCADGPNSTPTKSLVPYESDDTSSSEDSAQPREELRVTTKAALGEWQVSSSTDIRDHEPSSTGKSWKRQNGAEPVNVMFKMSHSGYSEPVMSWNGTRSQLDKEVASERREERKRPFVDSSDQGRVKHPKLNSNYKSNPGYNPIQVGNYFFIVVLISYCCPTFLLSRF